jgi:hygromycin-B 7''-O-kinase
VFLAAQVEGCRRRHERLPAHLLAELEPYLQRTRDVLPTAIAPKILTGEYTPGNLLMRLRGGRWEIAGLIDFGDVMVGLGEYDLLGPSTFLAGGDGTLVRALLDGYGQEEDGGLRERLMRMLLLHRYSNLGAQVQIADWRRAPTLEALAGRIWPDEGGAP